jgi:hypothetical protein
MDQTGTETSPPACHPPRQIAAATTTTSLEERQRGVNSITHERVSEHTAGVSYGVQHAGVSYAEVSLTSGESSIRMVDQYCSYLRQTNDAGGERNYGHLGLKETSSTRLSDHFRKVV